MPRVKLPVVPETLKWARKAAGYSTIDDAVEGISYLHGRPNGGADLMAWEAGEAAIGKTAATALGKAYFLPVPYFYLSTEIVASLVPDVTQIHDFRMVENRKLTPNLIRYLRSVLQQQELLRDILHPEDMPDLSWMGSGEGINPVGLAAQIRATLLLLDMPYPKKLTDWINLVEERFGVIVMQTSPAHYTHKVDKNFSGVALGDAAAPVIALNRDDSEARRAFTLMHELAHLFIGKAGISLVQNDTETRMPNNDVEKFCNQVAAETLMPRDDFLAEWRKISAGGGASQDTIKQIVSDTGISYSAAAVRAWKLDLISANKMQGLLGIYTASHEESERRKREEIATSKALGKPPGGMPPNFNALWPRWPPHDPQSPDCL